MATRVVVAVNDLLAEYGITNKKEFAKDCGLHPSTLYKLPQRKMLKLTTIAKLCYNLDVTPGELLKVVNED